MTEPTFPLPTARGPAFAALAGFGALHWMALLEPAEPGRALSALGAAGLALVGLLAAARLGGRARTAAAAAVAVPVAALGLLAGGVADEHLRPDQWGTLAAVLGRGIDSLPGVRVPYQGVDETIRLVIGVGGTLLVCAAALAAFWPRRRGTGYPAVALGLLVALYAIPAVALDFENEFLRGALLALLVLAFLRLEKLRPSDAGRAAVVAAGVAVVALMVAPALDRDTPWWDYERWAFGAVSGRSTAFSWDHDYGPLDWPRDGRELLRVRARRPMYWKAANLAEFDGTRWVHGEPSDRLAEPDDPDTLRRGRQKIRVTVRNLTSETFVTAGYAERVGAAVDERARGDGTWTAGRTLRLGDAYRATVYEPDANQETRRRRPRPPGGLDDGMTTLVLPVTGPPGQTGSPKHVVTFPAFGDRLDEPVAREARGSLDADADIEATDPARALDLGPYRRTWRLARRLQGEAETQEDLVQSVLAYLRRGFRYTETPPADARNLDGFLFDAKAGYCQQFSGAMALLLRMAGVPARIATGFTPGSLDRDTGEWVVRDLDAHSWVEVWYPELGWETFDPTPADSPARSQPNGGGAGGGPSGGGAPPVSGDRPADPGRRGPVPTPGTPWVRVTLAAAAGIALLVAPVLFVRRHRRRAAAPAAALAFSELERALRRARRQPGAGATLRSLEAAFARSPAAAGYVRAVRNMRYARAADPPTRAQRRALRGELGRGAGPIGRLRAWWALPPLAP